MPDVKFIADEGFSFPITSILREKGYDVIWIGDIASGVEDTKVFEISQKDGRIILTEDKDFGELAIRFKCKTSGIILLRIEPDQKELRERKVIELFRDFSDKLKGHLIIIDEQKFRFRKIEEWFRTRLTDERIYRIPGFFSYHRRAVFSLKNIALNLQN
ncbi:MAG: hypothetical protein GY950_06340 [bacterium]|nr:hypothetical protein [bacterium]